MMTSKAEAETKQADILPPPDDDDEVASVGDAAVSAEQAGTDDDKGQPPSPQAAGHQPDPVRDEIVQRYRQLRGQATPAADTAAGTDEASSADQSEAQAAPEAQAEVDTAPAADPAKSAQPTEITLIVDGKPVNKPLSEVIALAQITVAADNRLEEAKRLLNEAKTLRSATAPENPPGQGAQASQPSQPDRSPATPQAEHPPLAGIDRDKLHDLVERIQIGDKEEGAQALAEFAELVNAGRSQAQQLSPEQIGAIVEQQIFQRQTTHEITEAVEEFGRKYPEITTDQDFTRVAYDRVAQELRADLKAIGMNDQDLAPFGSDPWALATIHRQARAGGLAVRSYGAILDAVGDSIVTKFNLRSGVRRSATHQPQRTVSTQANDRLMAKRNAPQQPRTAGARVPTPQPRPKTAAEKIEEMRVARGFAR